MEQHPTSMQNMHDAVDGRENFKKQQHLFTVVRASRGTSSIADDVFPHNSSDVDGEFHLHKLVLICLWQTAHTTYGGENFPLML